MANWTCFSKAVQMTKQQSKHGEVHDSKMSKYCKANGSEVFLGLWVNGNTQG